MIEFRALARRAPLPEVKLLDAPKADPARVAAELAKLAPLRVRKSDALPNGKEWAHRLLARAAAGERIRPICLKFAKEAVGAA